VQKNYEKVIAMERVLLVTIKCRRDIDAWELDDLAQEMEELIGATGAVIVGHIPVTSKPQLRIILSAAARQRRLLCLPQMCRQML